MRTTLTLLIVLSLTACTTIQTRATSTAHLAGMDSDTAYNAAMHAAVSAGFTILATNKDSGFIIATRARNPFLTHQNPVINIGIIELNGEIQLNITSTVGGQVVDYGTTQDTVDDFCNALHNLLPEASCSQ